MFRLRLVPSNTRFPFLRYRDVCIAASVVFGAVSIVLAIWPGLSMGVDFRGGVTIEARSLSGPADLGALRASLGGIGGGDVTLQEFGSRNDVLIRIGSASESEDALRAAAEKVKETLGAKFEFRRVEFVGPQVSSELIQSAIWAVVLGLLAMMVYVWFRFEWQFSIGTIASLVHDVLLTVGLLAITRYDFNLSQIAAILTIIGYSMNDTVVVFDRVRENLRKWRKMPLDELLDLSINETLSRTMMTSMTTLLALIPLYFFGGDAIEGFAFTMIWGVFVGTYSSIFIAAPILIYLDLDKKREQWAREADAAALPAAKAEKP
jgi:preprotein translocase SecF subunit